VGIALANGLARRDHGRAGAWLIERHGAAPLVNQEGVIAADGDARRRVLPRRAGQTLWGSEIYRIDLGHLEGPDAAARAAPSRAASWSTARTSSPPASRPRWSIVLALFFQKTATGRALRAVADDHQAAQSIGIPLNRDLGDRLVGGRLRGAGRRHGLGQQARRAVLAGRRPRCKALPVVILGGFTSVPGAIIGGLIIGVGEKMAEVFLGSCIGGGIENWFAYVLALGSCWSAAGPVRRKDHHRRGSFTRTTCSTARTASSRQATAADQQIFPIRQDRIGGGDAAHGLRVCRRAAAGQRVHLQGDPDPLPDLALAAIGLNLLVGYCGQISLGTGASWRWGPTRPTTSRRIPGLNVVVACSWRPDRAVVGILFGMPSLRIKGLYLAVATLAAQFFVRLDLHPREMVQQRLDLGLGAAAPVIELFGLKVESPVGEVLVRAGVRVGVRADGQEPGARTHRAILDGDS
jgi:ABC-type branched-subunit amino acid transport system permease subunit